MAPRLILLLVAVAFTLFLGLPGAWAEAATVRAEISWSGGNDLIDIHVQDAEGNIAVVGESSIPDTEYIGQNTGERADRFVDYRSPSTRAFCIEVHNYGDIATPVTLKITDPTGAVRTKQIATQAGELSPVGSSPAGAGVCSEEEVEETECREGEGAIEGTHDSERLSGTAKDDSILGRDGDDVADGGGGKDCLSGGNGGDELKGGTANDELHGEAGEDLLDGKVGADVVEGGDGNDFVIGGADRDSLEGGEGDDILSDGLGRNRFEGGPGDDIISARQSIAEKIDCGAGKDVAYVDKKDSAVGCETVLHTGAPPFRWPENSLAEASGKKPVGVSTADLPRTLQAFTATSLAKTYAPLVYLAPGERYGPEVANDYIARSSLRWAHSFCPDHTAKRAGTVDPFKLSSKAWHPNSNWTKTPYYHRESKATCLGHTGRSYSTAEYTRPHDDGVLGNGRGRKGEGFYLNSPDSRSSRDGSPPSSVPVYYQCCFRLPGGWAITYWFFYAYDDKTVPDGIFHQLHEGDWERISVQFDEGFAPQWVAFYAHDRSGDYPGYRQVPWSLVETQSSHPVVYSARGSHASYPYADDPTLAGSNDWALPGIPAWAGRDDTGRGAQWDTSLHMSRVEGQAWWGYGGGWGQNSTIYFDSGPLGPSPWKYPYPQEWGSG